jgi:hypothetical protein
MSVPPVPPMGLASVHGAMISDIVVTNRPNTGRGKKLTLLQLNVLKRLYEQQLPSVPPGEVPVKSFWVNLVTLFRRYTGREYSWQSAKRNILGSLNKDEPQRSCQPTSPVEVASNESPIIEPCPPIVVDTPAQRRNLSGKSQSLEKREETPTGPPFLNSPACSELEESPAVVGEWTRRTLFPNAARSSQKPDSIPKLPRLSQSRRRSRSPQLESHPVYRCRSPTSNNQAHAVSRKLHHHLGSISTAGRKSGSNPAPSSTLVFQPRSEMKAASRKGNLPTNKRDSNLSGKEIRRQSKTPEQQQEPVRKSLDDSPYLSEPGELPHAPALISRRRHVTTKNEP